MTDMVNNPPHYQDASGIECIEVTKYMGFCDGNSFKYLYRAGQKGDYIEDLEKAKWYAKQAKDMGVVQMTNATTLTKIKLISMCRNSNIAWAMYYLAKGNWEAVINYIDKELENN